MSTMQRDYVSQAKEASEEEIRAGKEMDHGRWLGKQIAKAAIAEYDRTWGDHHGRELMTRQSQRKFANQLAELCTHGETSPLNAP